MKVVFRYFDVLAIIPNVSFLIVGILSPAKGVKMSNGQVSEVRFWVVVAGPIFEWSGKVFNFVISKGPGWCGVRSPSRSPTEPRRAKWGSYLSVDWSIFGFIGEGDNVIYSLVTKGVILEEPSYPSELYKAQARLGGYH